MTWKGIKLTDVDIRGCGQFDLGREEGRGFKDPGFQYMCFLVHVG